MPQRKDEYEKERDRRIERARAYWSVAFTTMRDALEADNSARALWFLHKTPEQRRMALWMLDEQARRLDSLIETLQNQRHTLLAGKKQLEAYDENSQVS